MVEYKYYPKTAFYVDLIEKASEEGNIGGMLKLEELYIEMHGSEMAQVGVINDSNRESVNELESLSRRKNDAFDKHNRQIEGLRIKLAEAKK